MDKLKDNDICRVAFTFGDGTRQLSNWENTYKECKRLVKIFKKQDKTAPYSTGKTTYKIMKVR